MTTISINPKTNVSFKDTIVEFNRIKASAFSGNVIIQVEGTPNWMLIFSAGRLAGISGGIDGIDRWKRSLALASANLPLERLIKSNNEEEVFLNSNKLAQEWAIKEVLFDIIQFSQNQGNKLSYQLIATSGNTNTSSSLPILDIQPLMHETIKTWQQWQKSGLESIPPSLFPVIKPQQIEQASSDLSLEYLIASIDGTRSLRSLAIHHRQRLIDLTTTLLPLLKTGAIDLVPPPNSNMSTKLYNRSMIANVVEAKNNHLFNLSASDPNDKPRPLIACIDDSIFVYKSLEKILTEEGYRCLGIQDPLKIIPTLIRNKPDLIFLDLVMPISNGYEVCEQIRKTPSLANIPVIILTGSDGFVDRVRSKLVGANGFMGKPAQAKAVLKTIEKYLSISKANKIEDLKSQPAEPIAQAVPIEMTKDFSKRVLVIDDDDNIREVVSMCLHKLKGWNIATASSGQEGLNRARTSQPDAIILDMMMPNMDGLAFLRHLRADPVTKMIPVLLLTASKYLPARQLLIELGVVDIIAKPFAPIQLVQQIDLVL